MKVAEQKVKYLKSIEILTTKALIFGVITNVTNNAKITTNFDTNQIPPNYRFTKDEGKKWIVCNVF